MATWLILILILLGLALLLFGKRLWLVGSGIGALLGASLVGLLPGLLGGWFGALVIIGLAVAFGILVTVFKGFTSLIAFGIGFLAGGTIALSILDLFAINLGFLNIVLALVIGLVGAVLARRFYKLLIVVFASLTGALLVARGVQNLMGGAGSNEAIGTLIVVVLAGFSLWYQLRAEKHP